MNIAFSEVGYDLEWEGAGIDEVARDTKSGKILVSIDPRYFRPAEVETLLGSPKKAKEKLDWEPEITVQEMCAEMVEYDLKEAKKNVLLRKNGFQVDIPKE